MPATPSFSTSFMIYAVKRLLEVNKNYIDNFLQWLLFFVNPGLNAIALVLKVLRRNSGDPPFLKLHMILIHGYYIVIIQETVKLLTYHISQKFTWNVGKRNRPVVITVRGARSFVNAFDAHK